VAIAAGPEEEREGSLLAEALQAGLRVHPIPSLRRRASILADRRALREIAGVIASFDPDVVHTHQSKAGVLGRMAATRSGGRRTVHSFHSPLERLGRDGLLRAANVAAEKRLARKTDRLLTVSESLRKELIQQEIVAADRVDIVHPLVEPARLFQERPTGEFRERLGLAPGVPLIAFIGRLAGSKDPGLFFRVLATVMSSLPESRAVVVGDGPERPAMETLSRKLGLEGKVAFTGWLPDVSLVYPEVDLLLLTSRYEGFALAAFEAMAAGRAVVGTSVTGVVDLVEHGRTGLLAPAGDAGALAGAAILLLRDAAYRRRLAAAGREAAWQRFARMDATPKIAAVYQKLLKGQPKASAATARAGAART